jgi:hypothetical protein
VVGRSTVRIAKDEEEARRTIDLELAATTSSLGHFGEIQSNLDVTILNSKDLWKKARRILRRDPLSNRDKYGVGETRICQE